MAVCVSVLFEVSSMLYFSIIMVSRSTIPRSGTPAADCLCTSAELVVHSWDHHLRHSRNRIFNTLLSFVSWVVKFLAKDAAPYRQQYSKLSVDTLTVVFHVR